MRSPGPGAITRIVGASIAFALAFFSPVEMVDSDPGIALLASQALLDHGSLQLAVYYDDPASAYDLRYDYRVRPVANGTTYYCAGVSVLSTPVVALANLAGFHMLDVAHEHALQNLISALCVAAIFVLTHLLASCWLGWRASLVVSAISVFGSPLMSTLATGLWNIAYSTIFLCLALLHLARREKERSNPNLLYLSMLLILAFAMRPSSAVAAIAFGIYLLTLSHRRFVWPAAAGLSLVIAIVSAAGVGWLPQTPLAIHYYSPYRLFTSTPLFEGLHAILISPSRGLLVYCPFIAVLGLALALAPRAVKSQRLALLTGVWILLLAVLAAHRPMWWGGHSFGPRFFTELIPAFVILTCIAWQYLGRINAPKRRRLLAVLYASSGCWAIFVHSHQGLFNPAIRQWNEHPNIDDNLALIFDWRYPQFLASEEALEKRLIEHQRRTMAPYRLGQPIAFDSKGVVFSHWYLPETAWRWSRGRSSAIIIELDEHVLAPRYLLAIEAGSLEQQEITVSIGGTPVGRIVLEEFAASRRLLEVDGSLLPPSAEIEIRFEAKQAQSILEDPRRFGLAVYSLNLMPWPGEIHISYDDAPYFLTGWSTAETAWRWSDGQRAVLALPIKDVPPTPRVLEVTAGALGRQRLELTLEGNVLGELELEGFEPVKHQLTVAPDLLRPFTIQQLELHIPGAVAPPDDPRRLGIALRSLTLAPSGQSLE